jgi:CheY-like chemotaxis protein/HPt (histidine-containing phosphotransfer) domain-containing protein
VVVVDDGPAGARGLPALLARIGLDAVRAANASDAAGLLRQAAAGGSPYDAVIVDLAAADDGLSVVAALRTDVALASTAVLLVTGSRRSGGDVDLDGHVAEGIDGYLTRPIRLRQLEPVLLSVLGRGPKAHEPTREPVPRHDDVHLLLAEDNPVNRKVVVHTLRRLGYDVDVVTNGEEALSALAARRFDAVLMDCQMPVRDGYSATRELRRREGNALHTPIIALTASAMTADRDRCLAAGMDDYLSKPVRADQLDAALRRWLAAHPATVSGPEVRGLAVSELPVPEPVNQPAVRPSAIDEDVLAELMASFDGDAELLADLVGTYLSEAGPGIEHLQEQARMGDRSTVRQVAHHLRSSSATLGAATLATMLRELEALSQDEAADLTVAAEAVGAEYERVHSALAAKTEAQPAPTA